VKEKSETESEEQKEDHDNQEDDPEAKLADPDQFRDDSGQETP
jgi:hypothetical protein